ncbi:hypothetical protein DD238_002699 [Peronospora effusa]|uniref:Uncharacterized protein n=1 Tax=Peronospora effusa TaxID=542832 RepID=A0A3M6VN03_9STRA|nr:hypothetical protein DD238_002699 [Peronospora effusa]RQM16859.1 hypothetical protein DD237_003448 [Peronospora effusa]
MQHLTVLNARVAERTQQSQQRKTSPRGSPQSQPAHLLDLHHALQKSPVDQPPGDAPRPKESAPLVQNPVPYAAFRRDGPSPLVDSAENRCWHVERILEHRGSPQTVHGASRAQKNLVPGTRHYRVR